MYRPPPSSSAPYGGAPPYPTYPNANNGYGNTYAPPPTPSYTYTPPPVAQPPSDPFRAYYASRLSQLTFNSRPIIQDLSVMAMQQRDTQNWQNMQSVVEEIESATLRAGANAKLPMLYLIDSISKNVGAPYTTDLLRPIIPRLYQKTYREVDGVTKAKMEEMIALWRTAGPNGTDLYGPDVRYAIERDILGTTGAFARLQQPAPPAREKVLALLHTTLDAKQRESAAKPWDATPRHQIGILSQIGDLLARTMVSPQELQHIMDQLRSMGPPPPPTPVAQPSYPAQVPAQAYPPAGRSQPTLPPFPPAMPPMAPTLATSAHSATPIQGSNTPIPPSSTPLPAPTAIPAGLPQNVADILRNLNSSGVLSNPRTPETKPATLVKSAQDTYEEMILNLDLRLENLDLNRMAALPTDHLPQRCKQCGIRFPEGEAKMQAHLDWHFRRNKQKTETERGRGAHRRWLPRAEEWVVDLSSNAEAGPSSKAAVAPEGGVNKLTGEQLKRYATRFVRVPTDPGRAGKPCPICKEHFKAELEDDEWIWRNAIEINGVVYHATCRAEQMNARKNARMLNPNGRLSASKSPGVTPQPGEMEVKVEVRASPTTIGRSHLGDQVVGEITGADVVVPADVDVAMAEEEPIVKQEPEEKALAVSASDEGQGGAATRSDETVNEAQAVDAVAAAEEGVARNDETPANIPVKRKAEVEGDGDEAREEEQVKRVKVDEGEFGTSIPIDTTDVQVESIGEPSLVEDADSVVEFSTDAIAEDARADTDVKVVAEDQTVEPIQTETSATSMQAVEDSVIAQPAAASTPVAVPPTSTSSMFDGIPGFGRS